MITLSPFLKNCSKNNVLKKVNKILIISNSTLLDLLPALMIDEKLTSDLKNVYNNVNVQRPRKIQ